MLTACRGAGPLQQVSGHGPQLLQLLLGLDIAGSQDSSIRAALVQLVRQLLVPHTLQQLIGESSSFTQLAATGTGAPEEEPAAAAAAVAGVEAALQNGSSSSSSSEGAGCEADAPVVRQGLLITGAGCSGADIGSARRLLEQLLKQLLDSSSDAAGGSSPELVEATGEQEWLAAALHQIMVT